MNYSFVDERRNRKFNMNEVPTVLISPVGMYGRVLKIENEKIFLENCNGDINERFRLRDLIESFFAISLKRKLINFFSVFYFSFYNNNICESNSNRYYFINRSFNCCCCLPF